MAASGSGTSRSMGQRENDEQATDEPRERPQPASPTRQQPGEDALAVDALPDETRLHGEGDETEMDQSTTGSPTPDASTTSERADEPPAD